MYTLSYFGQEVTSTGSIRDALRSAGIDVGNNQPYINGRLASVDETPPAGSNVTFRPAASGKA